MLDKKLLLAYLARWAKHRNHLIAAVAEGLITRINAGEFDTRKEDKS